MSGRPPGVDTSWSADEQSKQSVALYPPDNGTPASLRGSMGGCTPLRVGAPVYFLLRARRDGPLVPARLWLDDAEPGCPDNKLDRGRLSIYPRAEIAGREVEPERLFDRLMSSVDWRPAHAPTHWRFAQPIGAGEYQYRIAHLDWLRRHRPNDPRAHPNRALRSVDLPLPSFERERGLVG